MAKIESKKSDLPVLEKEKEEGPWWRPGILLFFQLSSWIAGPVIIALLLGKWLREKYDISSWMYLALVGVAFLVSIFGLIKEGKRAVRQMDKIKIEPKKLKTDNKPTDNNQPDEQSWRQYFKGGS